MELLDIRDEWGNITERTIERGQPMEEKDYVLGVYVLIRNREGMYLIQKRPMNKRVFPGRWDLTGGAVISGVDSREAVLREVNEEVGLKLDTTSLQLVGRLKLKNKLVDLWLVELDFSIEDCTACEDEVDEIALVTPEIMLSRIFAEGRTEEEYQAMINSAIIHK